MTTIDQIIIGWFNGGLGTNSKGWMMFGNLLLVLISLIMSVILSGLIGYERETHGHSAGLRTHLLISIGSALVMIVSVYGFAYWDNLYVTGEPRVSRDSARLAAQVVTGIGFIGAGSIVQNGVSVRGLTTAATLWVSMAIGLACGSGNFVLAVMATLVSLAALISMRNFERRAARKHPIIMMVVSSDKPVVKDVLEIANRYGTVLHDSSNELVTFQENSAIRMYMRIGSGSPSATTAFVDELRLKIHPLELKVSTEN